MLYAQEGKVCATSLDLTKARGCGKNECHIHKRGKAQALIPPPSFSALSPALTPSDVTFLANSQFRRPWWTAWPPL